MNDYSITIKSCEKKGVLDDITAIITKYGANISYTHLFVEKNNVGSINIELEHVSDIDSLIEDLNGIPEIKSVELHGSQLEIYGKRIIIVGGGAQVSQVAFGAITEADRHNIRGERISIDTIPLVGERNIAEAVEAISRLPRVSALVLAGSLMGGKITESLNQVKKENDNLIIISLNMPGSVTEYADLIITDPVQAGVLAVMSIADTAVFDISRLGDNIKF
jgi:energy-converting hydrogenase B subunit Q